MASIFFDDYHFPSELYNSNVNDFSTPIRTLLEFTPHILQNLPKDIKEQEPIQPTKDQSFEFMNESVSKQKNDKNDTKSTMNNTNYIQYAAGFARFLADCCIEYVALSAKHQNRNSDKKQEKQKEKQRNNNQSSSSYYWTPRQTEFNQESSSFTNFSTPNKTDNEKPKKTEKDQTSSMKNGKEKDSDIKEVNQQVNNNSTTTSTAVKSAAAIGALTFSIYSTYQASVGYGDITLQNQVELLLEHVESNLRSTKIWSEERKKMDDPVPELILDDMKRLRQLVDCLYRLDSRREKKIETAGWGIGIVGGLSALGGIALGSATILTGGAAAAVGAVLVTVASRGSNKSTQNIRMLIEAQVHQVLIEIKRDHTLRNEMLQSLATKSEQEAFEFIPSNNSSQEEKEQEQIQA
ncbi:hypothetical protein BDC45DRAFT_509538 [Circinella umbellata]|nr:hypothetical protein BDC45DRAFT_509538 [Circinella umbellata]